ncbi:MAG: TonB-dependent receptor domain-containing protein [Leptolyngbya sp. IPPAS B-1204]
MGDCRSPASRGGVRYVNLNISTDDYTTFDGNDIEGGTINADDFVFNAGLTYEIVDGLSAFASFSQGFSLVFLETLPQLEADLILALVSDHLRQDAISHIQRVWQQNPITQSLPTSRSGQVYFLDAYLFYNIRGPLAARLILDKIRELLVYHP